MSKQECENCFTCMKGVAPNVTKDMLDEAIKKFGRIPQEWLTQPLNIGGGDQCVECQKCFTPQGNCGDCFDCQKCFAPQGGERQTQGIGMPIQKVGAPTQGESTTYFIFLTNDCNLRCSYCYATKQPITMTPEILNQTIVFLTEMESKRVANPNISIQFFGGEPTTKWDYLTEFVERMNGKAFENKCGKVKWGMTTNGTLLDDAKLKWLKRKDFHILLSLDGREQTHDKHRKTVEGVGSWNMIPIDLFQKYFPNCEIRPTILPDTVEDWYDDLMWFYSKEFYMIATEVAYEADWNDEAMELARKTYNKLADLYIRRKQASLPMWMKFIDDGRGFLGATEQTGYICGVARGTIAIDGAGFLYACQRYASFSDRALNIGNVFDGFDTAKLSQTQDLKREYMGPDPKSDLFCQSCPARWRCRGGCNAMNFQCNRDRKIILENHCKFQRLWAEISLRALSATGELWQRR